nr:MAG TPA: bacteriocin [Caudoviricetes sp.]
MNIVFHKCLLTFVRHFFPGCITGGLRQFFFIY